MSRNARLVTKIYDSSNATHMRALQRILPAVQDATDACFPVDGGALDIGDLTVVIMLQGSVLALGQVAAVADDPCRPEPTLWFNDLCVRPGAKEKWSAVTAATAAKNKSTYRSVYRNLWAGLLRAADMYRASHPRTYGRARAAVYVVLSDSEGVKPNAEALIGLYEHSGLAAVRDPATQSVWGCDAGGTGTIYAILVGEAVAIDRASARSSSVSTSR